MSDELERDDDVLHDPPPLVADAEYRMVKPMSDELERLARRATFNALGACLHGCNRDPWKHDQGCSLLHLLAHAHSQQQRVEELERDRANWITMEKHEARRAESAERKLEQAEASAELYFGKLRSLVQWLSDDNMGHDGDWSIDDPLDMVEEQIARLRERCEKWQKSIESALGVVHGSLTPGALHDALELHDQLVVEGFKWRQRAALEK